MIFPWTYVKRVQGNLSSCSFSSPIILAVKIGFTSRASPWFLLQTNVVGLCLVPSLLLQTWVDPTPLVLAISLYGNHHIKNYHNNRQLSLISSLTNDKIEPNQQKQ